MAKIDETVKLLIELGAQSMKNSGINVASYSEKDIKKLDNKDYLIHEIKFDKNVVLAKQLINNDSNAKKRFKNEVNFAKWMNIIFKDKSPSFSIHAQIDDKNAILMDFSSEASLGEQITNSKVDMASIKQVAVALATFHAATDAVTATQLNTKLSKDFGECQAEQHQPYLTEVFATKHKSLILSQLAGDSIYIKDKAVKFLNSGVACIGPRSLDLGHLVAGYLIAYHVHMLTELNNDEHRKVSYQMVEATTLTISTYCQHFALSEDQTKDFIWEVARFAGEEIIIRAKLMFNDHRLSDISSSGHRLVNANTKITDEHRLVNIALALIF